MDMTVFVPRQLHRPLAWLGRLQPDWVIPHWLPDWNCNFSIQIPSFKKTQGVTEQDYTIARQIADLCVKDQMHLHYMHGLGKVFAEGPKVFEPTLNQCRMMGETEVRIPPVDPECPEGAYAQPYDAMIIKFPRPYLVELNQQFNYNHFPEYAICYHDPDHHYIVVSSRYGEDLITAFVPPDPNTPIEETLCVPMPSDISAPLSAAEAAVSQHIQRLCVNACLLLMEYKTIKRPVDPKRWAKNHQRKDERSQLLALGEMERVEFAQEFIVPEDEPLDQQAYRTGSELPQGMKKPHWRKRHWRAVPYGPGRIYRRRTLFHRVYVNKNRVAVDLSQTAVTFKGKEARS